jgi:hypothetical protein
MKRKQWLAGVVAGLGFALSALSGCQTWTAGMTLPSPRYLEHPPQYFPPSPPFPLARELASQEAAAAAAAAGGLPGGPAVPPPVPVPPGGPGPGGVVPLPPPPP